MVRRRCPLSGARRLCKKYGSICEQESVPHLLPPLPSRLRTVLGWLFALQIVVVDQVRARRAHICKPVDGWASLSTESGYVIMEAIARPTKYKVRVFLSWKSARAILPCGDMVFLWWRAAVSVWSRYILSCRKMSSYGEHKK